MMDFMSGDVGRAVVVYFNIAFYFFDCLIY